MKQAKLFQQMVQANPDRMSFVDANFIYREVNQRYINDSNCRREDIVGKHVSEFLGQEAFEKVRPMLESCLKGNPVRYQTWFDFKESGRRFMDVMYHPYRDLDGTVTGVLVTARDCTEQRLADEALAESRSQLNRIAEAIDDVVWFTDLDTPKVLFVSAAYERIWGRPIQGLYENALDWMVPIHPDDRARVQGAYREILVTGRYECEFRIIRPDGEVRWIHDRGFALHDESGGKHQLTGIAQDITSRKELERALDFEQERLKAFTSNSAVLAWMKDAEGRYVFLSGNYIQRFNLKPEDFLGKTDFELWPQEIAEEFRENDRKVLKENQPIESIEKSPAAKGTFHYWLSSKFPFQDHTGKRFVGGMAVDITRRVQLEHELDSERRRLQSFLDNSFVFAWMKDEEGRYVYISENFQKYIGGNVADWIGKTDFDKLPRELAESYRHNDAIVMRQNRPIEVVEEGVKTGGEKTWWICNKFPFVDETGARFVGGLGVDISSRVLLEGALELEKQRLRSFLNNSQVAAFMKDEAGRYVYVNDMLLKHFNARAEDWIGKTDVEIWPGPDTEALRAHDRAVIETETAAEHLERTRTRDGRVEWWLASKFPFRDAAGARFLGGLAVNVTDRVRAEQERQKFVLLAERSHEFIGICDNDFVPVYVNPAGRHLVGLDTVESIRQVRVADFFFPEDQKFIKDELFPRVEAEGHAEVEIRFRHFKTGEVIWMLYNVFRIMEKNGRPIGWGTVSRNITERKRAAQEERERNERIAHSQKLEAVGKLAAGMAHDINSLFMIVSGNAELIESQLRSQRVANMEQCSESLSRIVDAVGRGKALLNKLMVYGRVRTQRSSTVNVNTVVQETMRLVESTLSRSVQVRVELAPDLWSCESDTSQLLQVVLNLVMNANDAMPAGGTMTVRTENVINPPTFASGYGEAQRGPCVLLSVRDTGTGMDAQTMGRILEPYFSTKPMDKGSGLGLAIVHAIVKQARGYLTFASEVGKGSEFRVYLPAIL